MLVYHDNDMNKFYEIDDDYFVVDGANIAFEVRTAKNKPRLTNIHTLIKKFERNNIQNYKIICDRSLFYCIDDKKNYAHLLKNDNVLESPENVPADVFILQFAFDKNAFIISNDRFKNFNMLYEDNWINKHRISFRFIENKIYFDKLIIKGGELNG